MLSPSRASYPANVGDPHQPPSRPVSPNNLRHCATTASLGVASIPWPAPRTPLSVARRAKRFGHGLFSTLLNLLFSRRPVALSNGAVCPASKSVGCRHSRKSHGLICTKGEDHLLKLVAALKGSLMCTNTRHQVVKRHEAGVGICESIRAHSASRLLLCRWSADLAGLPLAS